MILIQRFFAMTTINFINFRLSQHKAFKMLNNKKVNFFRTLSLPGETDKEYINLLDLVMDAQKWRQKGEHSLETMTLDMVLKHVDSMKTKNR
jgi:hypothetical protein